MRTYWPVLLVVLLAACASTPSKPPVTLERVVELSRHGTPTADIIAEMRDAGTTYRLSGSQLARLRDQGVGDDVLDYMQDTYLSDMERRGRMYSYDPYGWGPYSTWGPYPAWGPYPTWAWGGYYPYYYGPGFRPHRRPHGSPGGGFGGGTPGPAPDSGPRPGNLWPGARAGR
jgi:hypothetical protein